MPLVRHSASTHDEAEPTRLVLDRIRSVLERAREGIHDEIHQYPSPIPACDEHFNHLLAKRSAISHMLTRLRDAESSSSLADCRRLVDDLVAANLLDEEGRAKLRSKLLEEGSREDIPPHPPEAPGER